MRPLLLSFFFAILGCTTGDRDELHSGVDASGALDLVSTGDSDPSNLCPGSFSECGGDVVGTWDILTFCPMGGGSLRRPCEHNFDNVPECQGTGGVAICTLHYGGTVTLNADHSSKIYTSIYSDYEVAYSDACLQAALGGVPKDICTSQTTKKLICTYDNGTCTCMGETDTQTETVTDTWQVNGNLLNATPSNQSEPVAGPYCITGNRMILKGPLGWAYWVLEKK